jgi:hypothetical protein
MAATAGQPLLALLAAISVAALMTSAARDGAITPFAAGLVFSARVDTP